MHLEEMRNFKIFIIALFLFSCRTAEYHEKKFYQKGGTFICKNDTISVHDTIIDSLGNEIIIVRDSIISKPVISYVPKYVYRYKYLERKAELKAETKQIKAAVKINRTNKKAQTKQVKQVEKTKRWSWWIWFVIGIISKTIWDAIYPILKKYVKTFI